MSPVDLSTFNLVQLQMILTCAPDREVLWNRLEVAARDEFDRRILALEQAA